MADHSQDRARPRRAEFVVETVIRLVGFSSIGFVLLIFLLAVQVFTGFFQASSSNVDLVRAVGDLHEHTVLNCLLVFCIVFHGAYGIRTMLMDLGVRKERLLFWVCTLLAAVLFAIFLVLFLLLVAA